MLWGSVLAFSAMRFSNSFLAGFLARAYTVICEGL